MKQSLTLHNAQQANTDLNALYQSAKGWLLGGGGRLRVRVEPETRSTQQNARMWAMLSDIASQVEWHGKKLGAEDWKAVFTASLKGMNVVPNLDNTGFVVLGQSTSRMSIRDMCELQDLMEAFGAQHAVRFSAPAEWEDAR